MYATSNSHFKGQQTVKTRLRSLIISNLISPQNQINWSPAHQTPSCDYTHDSRSSTIYTRVTNLKQCMYTHTMYTSTLLATVSGVNFDPFQSSHCPWEETRTTTSLHHTHTDTAHHSGVDLINILTSYCYKSADCHRKLRIWWLH